MPQKLSDRPEQLVRDFIADTLRPSEIEGYDPQQTDPTANDFLPVTTDWSTRGDYYPIISIIETDGPTVPNSGNTGYNGLQGNGSGPNQYTIYNVTLSCQAVEIDGSGGYLNGVDAATIVFELYQECHHQVQNNVETAVSEAQFAGMTPPTVTRSNEETDSGSTLEWIQRQGTVNVGIIDEP